MNRDAISALIAFVLAEAERDDEWTARELGPIHILKYLYLADLYMAEAGKPSVTGLPWRFEKFGPFCTAAPELIETIATQLGARRYDRDGQYGEFVRWRAPREGEPYDSVRRAVPAAVRVRLPTAIRRYGNRTPELLHHVYKTAPMLRASPGDTLSFEGLNRPIQRDEPTGTGPMAFRQGKRKRAKKIARFAEKMRARRASGESGKSGVRVTPAVEYDETFFRGLEDLEATSTPALHPFAGIVEIDESVWNSEVRTQAKDD